jgi:hypothetical protein
MAVLRLEEYPDCGKEMDMHEYVNHKCEETSVFSKKGDTTFSGIPSNTF